MRPVISFLANRSIWWTRSISASVALILALSQPGLSLAEEVKIIPNLQPPDQPVNLAQMNFDNTRPIGLGGAVNDGQLVARSLIRDPDPEDSLVIEIEIRPTNIAFVNQPNYASPVLKSLGLPMLIPILVAGLPEGQYHWQLRIKDQAGHLTSWVPFGGNPENEADLVVDLTPPLAPASVQVIPGDKSALVQWSKSLSADVNFYDVWRGSSADSLSTAVAQVEASQTSFTDSGLQDGTIYWYGIRAKDQAGNLSPLTRAAAVTTDIVIDDSAADLVTFKGVWGQVSGVDQTLARAGTFHWATGDSGATVTFAPTVPTAGQYEVRVSWLVNPPNFVGQQATNAPYLVRDQQGERLILVDQSRLADGGVSQASAWSGWHSLGVFTTLTGQPLIVTLTGQANGYVTTDAARFVSIRPLPPLNLEAVDQPNDNGGVINLAWSTSPSSTANRYRVYRAQAPGQYDLAKPLAEVTELSYTDRSAITGQSYWYAVTSFDGTRESVRSVESQSVALDTVAPARPAELNITDGDGLLNLTWPGVTEADRYELTIKEASTREVLSVISLPASQTSTKITSLRNEVIYTVDLVAIDGWGNRSPFIGVWGQPKVTKVEPVGPTVSRPAAVRGAAKRPVAPPPAPKTTLDQPPKETTVEVEPAPKEGEVKGAKDDRPVQNRLLITLLILVIAIVVGVGGYYGYDWWFGRPGQPPKLDSKTEPKPSPPKDSPPPADRW